MLLDGLLITIIIALFESFSHVIFYSLLQQLYEILILLKSVKLQKGQICSSFSIKTLCILLSHILYIMYKYIIYNGYFQS